MSSAISPSLARWLAMGSGIGIAVEGPVGDESLQISAVKVRPSGVAELDHLTIEDFQSVPCVEWGTQYASFCSKLGLGHKAAVAVLPRSSVIVRQVEIPGVQGKDLDGAIRFQLDGLHPWDDDDVYAAWARLQGSATVLVGIARREIVDRYTTLFAEAGIKIAGFTCSTAAIYSAIRVKGNVPEQLLTFVPTPVPVNADGEAGEPTHLELYGESAAKPLLSATYQVSAQMDRHRAVGLASSELRLEGDVAPTSLSELLGSERPLSYAAAVLSACPWRCLPFNLLPEQARQSGSRAHWVVTGFAAALLVLGAAGLLLLPRLQNAQYLASLQAEIARMQIVAAQAGTLDEEIEAAQQRTLMLADLKRRAGQDMDVLADLTGRLSPPTWLNQLQVSDEEVVASGIAPQAAPLLGVLDSSPLLEQSEFTTAPRSSDDGEVFRIRMVRSEIAIPVEPEVELAQAGAQAPGAAPASEAVPSPAVPSPSGPSAAAPSATGQADSSQPADQETGP